MLDQSLLEQVKTVFASLQNNYTLEVTASNSHPSKVELVTLLEEVASCSDKISTTVIEGENLSFKILKNGVATSIIFRAVPTGHEFTSLLLAILNADGIGKNLPDEVITAKIKALAGNITVNSYISLSCTNCPDVVQALNIISLINPNITHQIIDGSINQDEVERLNIQAVPAVYVNDKVLQDKLKTLSNVEIITNAETVEVHGDGAKVNALSYKERTSGEVKKLVTDGVFVQIGLTANSSVVKDIVATNRVGEIIIDAHCRTNVPGIYAAGDVSVVPYKQIVIAMGEGAKAALSAFDDTIKGQLLS